MTSHKSNNKEGNVLNPDIFLVGGTKGGVGKTLVSIALLDHLQQQGEKILLIETDTSNPDVWKTFDGIIPVEGADFHVQEGWFIFVDACESHSDSAVVVNTAADNMKGILKYGTLLNKALGRLKRRLVVLWVINRHRDSLESLKQYMESVADADVTIHVVRNLHFGEERQFDLYNNSQVRKTIEERGGKSLNFPDLADRVADDIYINRKTIAAALEDSPLANTIELERWREEAGKMFEEVIDE